MKIYHIIGLMSGTSLDGLDVCYVRFEFPNLKNFQVIQAETFSYDNIWKNRLKNSIQLSGEELIQLDIELGIYFGKIVNRFLKKHTIQKVDFIASHGHTVFHNPTKNYTLQIGNGLALFTEVGIPIVYDFRSQDIFLGGQGAPLVPIGDKSLFSEFDACLNLGGFSNISFDKNQERIAFDVSPFNVIFNYLAEKLGKPFDEDGKFAQKGTIDFDLLAQLNQLDYYKKEPPKSLGIEWCHDFIFPILESSTLKVEDLLATFCEHFAIQIAAVLNENGLKTILITGGGTYNKYFIQTLQSKTTCNVKLPENTIIDYKEALIFALMGLLKIENQINIFSSVTGAKKNHSSGLIIS